MKRLPQIAIAATAAAIALATAVPAQAATGQVVVFSHEFQPLAVFTDPSGCHKLPIGAHQVNNQTDGDIRIYADPLCLIPQEPFSTIRPGYGAHVANVGSFSS
ncbi:hypothetical protein [Nonomuraea sp. NPDC023979]|uniref:hypothetical protein n=1 Tax=Nonomuraea sp. NPDC023979 TaxID=3154796 RepID=UPI0033D8114A